MAATWKKKQQNECGPSEDSDQPGHPPSLISVFAVRMKKEWVLSYPLSAQRRLWSDWADAKADLRLRWAHSHFVGFVMRRLSHGNTYREWTHTADRLVIYTQVARTRHKTNLPEKTSSCEAQSLSQSEQHRDHHPIEYKIRNEIL